MPSLETLLDLLDNLNAGIDSHRLESDTLLVLPALLEHAVNLATDYKVDAHPDLRHVRCLIILRSLELLVRIAIPYTMEVALRLLKHTRPFLDKDDLGSILNATLFKSMDGCISSLQYQKMAPNAPNPDDQSPRPQAHLDGMTTPQVQQANLAQLLIDNAPAESRLQLADGRSLVKDGQWVLVLTSTTEDLRISLHNLDEWSQDLAEPRSVRSLVLRPQNLRHWAVESVLVDLEDEVRLQWLDGHVVPDAGADDLRQEANLQALEARLLEITPDGLI